jgi:phosphate transport system protein
MPRIHFQQQLAGLKDKLLAMASLAQQSVNTALEAYLLRDERQTVSVIF